MTNDKFKFNSAEEQHELELAFARAGGWNSTLIKELCKGNILDEFRGVLTSYKKIVPVEHFIDMGANAFIPNENWEVLEHVGDGLWKWEPKNIKLIEHMPNKQDKLFQGYDAEKELILKTVFNANLLDYLLRFPKLIPKEWDQKCIYFWGTKYKFENDICVRFLYADIRNNKYEAAYSFLISRWDGSYAAVLD